MNALVLVGMLVAAVVVAYVLLYNRLARRVNAVDAAWAQVDVQLERRWALVPNLVETVRAYAAHEASTLQAVTAARTAALAAAGPAQAAQADGELGVAVARLMAVAEAYPDLKASEQFLSLQSQLAETEDRVAYARLHYNAVVRDLNTATVVFPSSLVAARSPRFAAREFFEAGDGRREAPKVGW